MGRTYKLNSYEINIGLEIHAQLRTNSKMFCGCSTLFGAEPNTHTCPICLGMPGSLPFVNLVAVKYGVLLALAIEATVQPVSQFARKNYFYPDLPKGYQITQHDMPLAKGGAIKIFVDGNSVNIPITRVHLEEDAGKSFHEGQQTLIDFNRSGIPLVEVVTEPIIHSPEEAVALLRKFRTLLKYLGISDGNMEQGSMRCDTNLSLRKKNGNEIAAKIEIKNLNSFRSVYRALYYEVERQKKILARGESPRPETRLWDEETRKTLSMRIKEESSEYRYFPEPDLVPVVIKAEWIKRLKDLIPEMPDKKLERFMSHYGLSFSDASILCESMGLANYFEECARILKKPKLVSNWIINELLGAIEDKEHPSDFLAIGDFVDLLILLNTGKISGKMAKSILYEMLKTGVSAKEIFRNTGTQITNAKILTRYVEEVISEHPEEVKKYRSGKEKLLGFFVGQVMKKSAGRANPQLVKKILIQKLH